MFKDEDWRRRIVTTRESCVHRGLHEKAGEGAGLLGGNAIVKVRTTIDFRKLLSVVFK